MSNVVASGFSLKIKYPPFHQEIAPNLECVLKIFTMKSSSCIYSLLDCVWNFLSHGISCWKGQLWKARSEWLRVWAEGKRASHHSELVTRYPASYPVPSPLSPGTGALPLPFPRWGPPWTVLDYPSRIHWPSEWESAVPSVNPLPVPFPLFSRLPPHFHRGR